MTVNEKVESVTREPDSGGTGSTAWAGIFDCLAEVRRDTEPTWLAERRAAAMARFRAEGFPTARLEDWRYTRLDALRTASLTHQSAQPAGEAPPPSMAADLDAIRLVLVDGRHAPELGTDGELPDGLELTSLARELERAPETLEPWLARGLRPESKPFLALSDALFEDGALVRVAPGAHIERTIHVEHRTTGAGGEGPARATQARSLILLGENASARVVESYTSTGACFTNAVTEGHVAAGARLEHVKLQEESLDAWHLATTQIEVEQDGELRSHLVSLGARLTRNLVEVLFRAPGASCALHGVYVVGDGQHADCQTFVDHAFPHGTSEQNYRGILAGDSRGVFQGGVLVRPDAQKTSARQSNKNLVLSDRAKADAKPQLEIHADDVQCAHGATIGELDPDAIFFLRSRGIDEAAARGMLTGAFAGEIAQTLTDEALHARVKRAIADKLSGAGAGLLIED